jgi:Tfp pilus assembly protein PilF
MGMIENFEAMLASGQDNALLRYSLGAAYLKEGEPDKAVEHLEQAVRQDPEYSAAWKTYAGALAARGDAGAAVNAYRTGIAVAEKKGDIQAAREMKVFLRRLEKQGPGHD